MRVVDGVPPMFDAIDAAFHVRGRPILFAWGDRIFNPARVTVPPELLAHEAVHGERQWVVGIVTWWERYIASAEYRLREELPAHVAEFKSLCEQHRHQWTSERNMRRTFAAHVARKLAAPLYGNLITVSAAKEQLLAA